MAQEQGKSRLYTVQEVAELLSVPVSWVYSARGQRGPAARQGWALRSLSACA